jgi:biopolymer transport protein ExbB/TolQ
VTPISIWAVVAITISMAVIATAIGTAIVSVVVGNLFDRRVRDSGTIQHERGHGGAGWAGTRK